MANTKLNILKHPRQLLLVISVLVAAAVLFSASKAQAAACAAPSTDMGSVTSTVNITTAGTYRAWSRIMSGTASTDNSYMLEIDGNTCYTVGDLAGMPAGSWQWVDYQNGTTTSKINVSLTAGNHTIKMIGREDGVKLDRVIFATDTSCTPVNDGSNCVTVPDTTNPTASISSPAANSKHRGTISVTASVSDNSGTVSKVELYADNCSGTPVATVNNPSGSTVNLSWNTAAAPVPSNNTHNLYVKAYDPSNNSVCSSAVSVLVDNAAPSPVSLTAPTAGQTISNTFTITASATDNTNGSGIASVQFILDNNAASPINTDTVSPYSYSWNTSSIPNGTHTLQVKATDTVGNTTTTANVSFTISNSTTPADTEDPTTSITTPVNNAILLYGNNTVNVSASDNVGVTQVELYIDGVLKATDVASPFVFSVSTSGLSNGTHSMTTKAYDAAGRTGNSAAVSITINTNYTNPGDVDGQPLGGSRTKYVDIIDLSTLLTNYPCSAPVTCANPTGAGNRTKGDLDSNGIINIIDLSILLTNYGT